MNIVKKVTITLPLVIANKVILEVPESLKRGGFSDNQIEALRNEAYVEGMVDEDIVAMLKLTTALEKAVPDAFEGGRRQGKSKPKTRRNRKAKRNTRKN